MTDELDKKIVKNRKDLDHMDPMLNKIRHKNRRNMAWVSLFGIILLPLVIIMGIDPALVSPYVNLVTGVVFALTSVIMTYMGSTTWDSVSFRNLLDKDKE